MERKYRIVLLGRSEQEEKERGDGGGRARIKQATAKNRLKIFGQDKQRKKYVSYTRRKYLIILMILFFFF